MGRDGTCSVVQSAPSTRAISVVAGEVGPGAVDVGGGSWALGSAPGGPPMLPEGLEWSFEDRHEQWVQWVPCRSPEVGKGVYYSLAQLEGGGDLQEVW